MTKAEILTELPKLDPQERREIWEKLCELDNLDDFDDEEMSPEQAAIIEERLVAHERDPASSIPLSELLKRLDKRP